MTQKSNLKKHLLVGVSAVAFGAFASQASAAVQTYAEAAGTVALTAGNSAAFTGTGVDEIATVADTVNVGGGGLITTSTTNGVGTLTFAGDSTATGTIGASSLALGVLNAGAAGKAVAVSGDSYVTDTNVTGTGTLTFAGSLTGTTLDFDAAGNATFSSATASVAVTTIDFKNAAGVLTVANGGNLTGSGGLLSTGGTKGTLTFSGATTADSTITGNAGATGANLNILNHIAGLDGSVLTLNGASNYIATTNIGAGQVALNGSLTGNVAFDNAANTTGKLTVAAGKNVTGNITAGTTNEGLLVFSGASTWTGDIGAAAGNLLNLVTINSGAITATGNVAATTVNFAADGSLAIANGKTLEGNVTNTTTGQGTVTFAQGATVTGSLGASADVLKLVTLGGTTAGTVGVSGDIYATTVNFGTDSTLTVADTKTLSAAVTATTTKNGTINYTADATQTGNLGTSSVILKKITVANGNTTKTLTVSGGSDIYAETVTYGTDADAVLKLSNGSDVTGAIVAQAANKGILTLDGGSTITGAIGATGARLKTINVDSTTASHTVRFTDDVFAATFDATSSTATIRIDQGKTVTATNSITAALAGSAKYQFGIKEVAGGTDLVGKLASDAAILLTNASVDVLVDSTGGFTATGDVYKIADGTGAATLNGGGASNTATGTVTDNSYVLSFQTIRGDNAAVTAGSDSDIYVKATRANTLQSAATNVNEAAVGRALESVGNSGNAALDTIQAALAAKSSATEVANAVKTLDTTNSTSGATTQAVINTLDVGTVATNETRLASLRNDSTVATGNMSSNNGAWGEVFGSNLDQGWRKGVDGYQAKVGGFALGADTAINSQTRIGAAFAYANTDADGTGNSTKVDSYQGSVYGSIDQGKVFYEGIAAFAFNTYDTSRTLFDNSVASGDFDGQQYSAKATAGYKLDVQGGLKVTPFASAQYTFLTQDSYTETGSNANLHVKSDDINVFKTGLGAKLAYPIVDGGITYTPRLSAGWYYDLIGDEAGTTSNFSSAAATTFVSKGADVARSAFKLGTGLDILSQDNVTLSVDYNWESKEDFDSHTGELKARFAF